MMQANETFNPNEYCSRKLWDLVNHRDQEQLDSAALRAAVAELKQRSHYLDQLDQISTLQQHG